MYATEETNAYVNEPSRGPGAELDRILNERQSVRNEIQRLQETAEKLDAKARELVEVLNAQVDGPKNTIPKDR